MHGKNLNSRTPRVSPQVFASSLYLLQLASIQRLSTRSNTILAIISTNQTHMTSFLETPNHLTHCQFPRNDNTSNQSDNPRYLNCVGKHDNENSRKTTLHHAADVQLDSKSTNLAHRSSTLPPTAQTPKNQRFTKPIDVDQ